MQYKSQYILTENAPIGTAASSGKTLRRGNRRDCRKRQRKVRNTDAARERYLNALSWLVRHAYPDPSKAYTIKNIEALVYTECGERAVANYIYHAVASDVLKDPDKTSSGSSILSALETLATRNDFPKEVVWALDDACYDRVDSYQVREMSLEREAFVKLVDRNSSVAGAIVSGSRRLMTEAVAAFDRWDDLAAGAKTVALHLSLRSTLMVLQLARAVGSRKS